MTQNFNLGLLGQHINVTSTSVTLISNTNFSANIALANNVTLLANGSVGTAGQVLASNGTGLYWSTGPSGYSGSAGPSGGTGYTGSTGAQGNQGYTGSIGSSGTFGYSGSTGPIGYTGSIGSQGNIGYTGSAGYNGSVGYVGSIGSQGIQGYTGSSGQFAGGYVGSVSTTSVSTSSVTSNTGVIDLLTSQSVTVVQGISVGNTTVNTSITALQIFSGNTNANSTITASSINVTNSTSNSTITSQIIFVGNTTANASFNLIGGTATFNASRLSVNANGAVTIQTATNHSLYGAGSVVGTLASLSNFDRAWLNNPRLLIANTPTPNTISFTLGGAVIANSALKINAVKRVDGLITYETVTPHGLLVNDVINITGTPSSLDSGRFNITSGIVNTVPTSNTLTIYDNIRANKTVISSNSVAISTSAIPFATAGNVYLTLSLDFVHQIKVGELVTISNITGKYSGATYTPSNPNILNRTFNLNGNYTVSSVTSNTFTILAFAKPVNSATVTGGSNTLTYSGTFRAVVNNDISNTKITTAAYSSLPIVSNIPVTNGTIRYDVPIYINVGNTVSATKITPTSIFVGDLAGNSVVIDSAGTRYKKTGSILQTTVDGSGFGVTAVLDDGGTVDPFASAFIANTSIVSLGNTISTTVLTQEAITTSNVIVGLNDTKVRLTQDSISIEDNTSATNTVITNYLASFPSDLYVGDTLYVNAISDANGSIGTDGQVLTSNGVVSYWATPTASGGSTITISGTPPASPAAGNLWWNSNIGSLYIYYNDGDSSQWVEASPGGAGGSSSSVTSGRSFTHAWFFGG